MEWRSELVPRYQRRSERVDEAILVVYLSGTKTWRIQGALAPLLRWGPLSKDAVSACAPMASASSSTFDSPAMKARLSTETVDCRLRLPTYRLPTTD